MSAATVSGTCACGAEVTRPAAKSGHGWIDTLTERVPFMCDDCVEREHQWRADQEALVRRREQERLAERRFAAAGLPARYGGVELDQLDQRGCEDAFAAARRWATGDLDGLLLTGSYGTGKSTIAAGALRLLLRQRAGHWLPVPVLLARLGASFGKGRDGVLDVLTGRGALVLDDIDKARPTDYAAEQLFLAVDTALAEGRPLLVTTNLVLGELAERYPAPCGEALVSRLVGYCHAIHVGGPDRRLGGVV